MNQNDPPDSLEKSAPDAGLLSFSFTYTDNFPTLLGELGISLAVSTCDAQKVIVVRKDGDILNAHCVHFSGPTGVVFDAASQRLAIGTRNEVWEFHNCGQFTPADGSRHPYDALFLPRICHYSGDIRIHEMGWVDNEIWAVNTRFSCLCTFDGVHSFVPRWRPPFISALASEDRCHMNGMAVVDGRVRYVTCLGMTDDEGGWRRDKPGGGCVLDVVSGEPLVRGLAMPHSPRVHGGREWLLESGRGTLSLADFQTGRTEIVAKFPGFTRGLDFHGHFAFVGLSQIRETAFFSGIPIVEEHPERVCGIGVVDLRSGQTVAAIKFAGTVEEVFSVVVLPGFRFPSIIKEPGPELDFSYALPPDAQAELAPSLRSEPLRAR